MKTLKNNIIPELKIRLKKRHLIPWLKEIKKINKIPWCCSLFYSIELRRLFPHLEQETMKETVKRRKVKK